MEFFNELWANRLQYWTIWFEVVGFSLTFIEVLKPELADRIEARIDELSQHRLAVEPLGALDGCLGLFGIILMSLVLLVGLLMTNSKSEFEVGDGFIIIIVMIPIIGSLTYILLIRVLGVIINKLNAISNGHALGTLGLIIALIGLLGEAYQYITMVSQ